MILILLLLFPPVISLGLFLHERNDTFSKGKTLLLYGIFTLIINFIDCFVILFFFNAGGFVLSPEHITISFVCKYLVLSTCIAVFTAYAVRYSINILNILKRNLSFRIQLEDTQRKVRPTTILLICSVILILFDIRYIELVLGRRALNTYFNISNTMPLNSNEYFNFSAISKHIILPTVFTTICITAVYFLFCRLVKYRLSVTCNSKFANKEFSLFSGFAQLYKIFFIVVLFIAFTMCIYIGYIFYLHDSDQKLPDWIQNSNGLIAHALGGIDEDTYLNSIDAMQYNYDNGHRVFEMDLCLTSDKVLVGIHDWNQFGYNGIAPSIDEFMSNKILDKYTPTSFRDVAEFMFYHQDVYIVTDKIYSNDELAFYNIINECNSLDPSILSRIIIQVYNQSEYYEVIKKYPYFKVLYTLYASPDKDDEVVSFVEKTGIKAITMWDSRVSVEFAERLKQRGAIVFAHTINSADAFEVLRSAGAYGVYTDYLNPEDIKRFMMEAPYGG